MRKVPVLLLTGVLGLQAAGFAAVPSEVSPPGSDQPLVFSSKISIEWEDGVENGSTEFNLRRGDVASLRPGYGSCIQSALPSNRAYDRSNPGASEGWFYLVTGLNDEGEGPMGTTSEGRLRESLPCFPIYQCGDDPDQPGTWCVRNDLVYVNQWACLVVRSDNVTIEGSGPHSIIGVTGRRGQDIPNSGIDLRGHSGIVIRNLDIAGFDAGIYAPGNNPSSDVLITGCYLHENMTGADWTSGNRFRFIDNIVEDNDAGVFCGSTDTVLAGNTISNNDTDGLSIGFATGVVEGNRITGNGDIGIAVYPDSTGTVIRNNVIATNWTYGIVLQSSGLSIYGNTFRGNNDDGVLQVPPGLVNIWDNGYPEGGNYWSSYDTKGEGCSDDYSGPDQDQPGPDGICDTPGSLGDVVDNYPLVEMPDLD